MIPIQSWVFFSVILCLVLTMMIPNAILKEGFTHPSFSLYKTISNETDFYKQLYGLKETEFKDELLWMDRCIKIPMTYDLNSFIQKAKFPIIKKFIQVNSYRDIEQTLLTELKNFYLNNQLKTLHGPVYVLMGQAPRLTAIDDQCKSRNLAIQFTTLPENLKGLSSYTSISPECKEPNISSSMSIYMYVLFPTYNKKAQFVYRSWENIKCHLSELLSYRSKEYPCFLNCVNHPNVSCGCINQQRPYKAMCLGDTEQGGFDSSRYNYWNLYVINTSYVNQTFHANLDTPFFSESVEIKPFDTNLQYCGSNKPILEMNKALNPIELKTQERYRITHIPSGKCLDDVPIRSTEKLDTCVSKENQYWIAESVPGQSGFYLKNVMTGRYLKASYNSMAQKVSIQTIQKYSFTVLQRWTYVDYQLQLLDPIEGITLGSQNYLSMVNDRLTVTSLSNSMDDLSVSGIFLGVGTNNHLYTKTSLTATWLKVDDSCCVLKVHVLKNGLIVGVGTDNQLYTKQKLTSPWVLVSSSCCVIDIAEMLDGTLLGIGTDNRIYTKKDLYASWVYVDDNNCCIKALHVMKDGTLLGVKTNNHNNHMYTKTTLTSPWEWVNPSCCVYDVCELSNGNIIGVGTDNRLYKKTRLSSGWTYVDNNTCCVISIAFLQNKADIVDTLNKTWLVEPIAFESTTMELDTDRDIDNRNLRKYLLSL